MKKAMADSAVIRIVSSGFFLASAFSSVKDGKIGDWILLFYNSTTKKTIDCYVSDNVSMDEEMPAMKEMQRLDVGMTKITAEDAVKMATERFSGKPISTLITLSMKGSATWTITFITEAMLATTYEIDPAGAVAEKETVSLIRRI